ncbi:MAG: GDSL-type esterase/lipase family protein [Planctomycetota bacterium]
MTLSSAAPLPRLQQEARTAEQAPQWHGYRRLDFTIAGKKARLVIPEHPAPGRPWVWRARFPDFHAGADRILLERGFHIAHLDTSGMLGGPKAMAAWDTFYNSMVSERGLAPKPALEGVSRGGLFVYRWASQHPERVACIYADTPVCDIRSWPLGSGQGRGHPATWQHLLEELNLTEDQALSYEYSPIDLLEPIVAAGIPILHIVSRGDEIVPPEENTDVLAKRYRALGGTIDVINVAEGTEESGGHHFTHPDPLRCADFMERHASAAPDVHDYLIRRATMTRTARKFRTEGSGRIAFLGGSITYNPGWRDQTCAYLTELFPEAALDFVAAGIPSTGSTPGAFRMGRDVFSKGDVDLLFVEAAVNDSTNGRSPAAMTRGMEGILRGARLRNPDIDLVVLHFVDPSKMKSYRQGEVPLVIQKHEAVAEHYGASTVQLAREVTERIDQGQFSWKEDFKNLHPSPYGQRLYAASIRRLLSTALRPSSETVAEDLEERSLPAPLDPHSYSRGMILPPAAASPGTFELVDSCDPRKNGVGGGVRDGFVDVPMLVGTEPGQSFTLPFEGRAIGLWVAAGPDAGTIEYSIDEAPWASLDLFGILGQ